MAGIKGKEVTLLARVLYDGTQAARKAILADEATLREEFGREGLFLKFLEGKALMDVLRERYRGRIIPLEMLQLYGKTEEEYEEALKEIGVLNIIKRGLYL